MKKRLMRIKGQVTVDLDIDELVAVSTQDSLEDLKKTYLARAHAEADFEGGVISWEDLAFSWEDDNDDE